MSNNLFKKIIKNSLLWKFVKYILIGYTFITLLLISIIFWFYQFYFSGPNAFQINEYHPFKSVEAKNEYLILTKIDPDNACNIFFASSTAFTLIR